MKTWYLAVIGSWLLLGAIGQSQENLKFEVSLEQAEKTAAEKRDKLFDQYAVAVAKVQAEFQNAGDLTNAVKAREEARKAKEQRVLGSAEIPNIEKLRKIMEVELDKIRLAKMVSTAEAREVYIGDLATKSTALTKAGKLDEALAANAEAETEKSRLATEREEIAQLKVKGKPAAVLPSAEPVTPAPSRTLARVKSPLSAKEALTGEVRLAPGIHRLSDKAVVGVRGTNKKTDKYEDIKGNIVSGDGTVISGGGIFVNNGTFKGERTRFEKVRLSEELQGKWTLKSCLLEDCEFRKDGGWGAGPYSARWDIEDSVFEGTFFDDWDSLGLKLVNCTFLNIKFRPFDYKKDAGEEARSDGRRLINCLFVDCTVPASTALATEGCVFRNCKFTKDMGSDLNVETEIETVLYFAGDKEPETLKLPDGIQLTFKPAKELEDPMVGSNVRFTSSRGKLDFE